MADDPDVRSAAMALLLGHDPLPGPFLLLDDDDRTIAVAVLEEAIRLRNDTEGA